MTNRIAAAALLAFLASGPAAALSLDQVSAVTSTQVDVASDLSYDPVAGLLDFTGLVTGTTAGLAAAGLSDIAGLALVDNAGTAVIDGLIDDVLVFDSLLGVPLAGQIEDIAFGAATSTGTGIEILLATVSNTLDAAFDGHFLATITGFAGDDTITGPLDLPDAGGGGTPLAALTRLNPVSVNAVPLPAAGWFLLGGLGGLGLLRLRRAA